MSVMYWEGWFPFFYCGVGFADPAEQCHLIWFTAGVDLNLHYLNIEPPTTDCRDSLEYWQNERLLRHLHAECILAEFEAGRATAEELSDARTWAGMACFIVATW